MLQEGLFEQTGARQRPGRRRLDAIGNTCVSYLFNGLLLPVIAANAAMPGYEAMCGNWWSDSDISWKAIATVAQTNFALAIIRRQQHVINLLSGLAVRAPIRWPLKLQLSLAKVRHFG